MEKRSTFNNLWLPYLLLAPQIIITFIFFIWPASQALYQSFLLEDAFGLSSEFVWFENFEVLFSDPLYLDSINTTFIFSAATTILSLSTSLLFAVMADRVLRGAGDSSCKRPVTAVLRGRIFLLACIPCAGLRFDGHSGAGLHPVGSGGHSGWRRSVSLPTTSRPALEAENGTQSSTRR